MRAVRAVDDGGDDREAERTAELERRVEQTAGQALLVRGDPAHGRDVQRREREAEAEAAEQHRRQHPEQVARPGVDGQEQQVGERDRRQPGPDQAGRAVAHDQRRDARCEDRHDQAGREDREAGLERRPAAQLLQVQGQHELEADPGAEQRQAADVGPHERARAEDAEAHERRAAAALDRYERGQDGGDADERAERAGRAPADVGRLDDGVDEQQHAAGHEGRADQVEAPRVRCDAGPPGTSLRPPTSSTAAIGTGRKNTQRQPSSVSRPPITRPSEKPVAPVAV